MIFQGLTWQWELKNKMAIKTAKEPDLNDVLRMLIDKKKEENIEIKPKAHKGIPLAETKDDKFYVEAKQFDPTENMGWWAKRKYLKQKKKESAVLIKMEMANGIFREFIVSDGAEYFYNKKNQYVLDEKHKYYILERDIWCYNFSEVISISYSQKLILSEELQDLIKKASLKPMKPHIPANEIKTLIENSKLVDVENSLNPTTLKRFTDSEVIKEVLQGAALGKIFKIIMILTIIIAILTLLTLLVSSYSAGVFEKLSGLFSKKG